MKLEFSWQIFHKFHENPSHGSQVVPCKQTNKQTDVTKLIVPFHNSANVTTEESISFSVAKQGRNRITKRERRWNKLIQFGKSTCSICFLQSALCFLFQIHESVLLLQCTFVTVMLIALYDEAYASLIKFQFLVSWLVHYCSLHYTGDCRAELL